ncbi:Transposase IS116/IS110/IS902 family protein [Desulforamulus putei DSM 12395]|uniref:Transposase IS116/IS110/IS902 family protein n=1 Tax=Desulforamulus putei DSM 12395 TaxID=1121429 RepID=A0A1M4VIY2_9FIRM|nr:IS110 family transposase [Desulforamulus putei]SHE68944.1 Transposase IS116/IS110/IS902 family protein [Desulforamulus putei DSM 12395]
MKYTQNEKILQVTEKTLIVGVDIASETHYARAFDQRGVELSKLIRFSNDAEGFKKFALWVEEIKARCNKHDVMVGMEPTGHYWFNIAPYLKDHKMRIVLVNPFHVKRSKEVDDNNPTKNDRKDPKTIAMLVKDGRYMEPYIPEGIYSELRTAMETRWQIVKQLNAIRNRVKRWISIYFPEFNKVFGDWEGKAALIALKEFPTPARVLETGVDGIIARWKQDKLRAVGRKRASALIEAARKSVGVSEGLVAAENDLAILIEDYEMRMRHYERTMVIIEQLAYQIPGLPEMLKIKGIGLVTAAGFIAEVGDISRFEHPKQIQKLAGLSLKENSSGKHKGQTTISKRGRRRLRALLFQGIMPVTANNPEFRELHSHYTTRDKNPLKKKQSLILLSCKLIRIFFALLKKGTAYDPQKMLNDIKRPLLQEVA